MDDKTKRFWSTAVTYVLIFIIGMGTGLSIARFDSIDVNPAEAANIEQEHARTIGNLERTIEEQRSTIASLTAGYNKLKEYNRDARRISESITGAVNLDEADIDEAIAIVERLLNTQQASGDSNINSGSSSGGPRNNSGDVNR